MPLKEEAKIFREKRHERFIDALSGLKVDFINAEIEKRTSYKSSAISLYLNGKQLASEGFIKAVCAAFPELDLEFILNGTSEPNAGPTHTTGQQISDEKAFGQRQKRKVPVLGVAKAGNDEEIDLTPVTYVENYIDVGDLLSDSEAAFTVYGNSMTPNYPAGSVLGLKRNYDGFIQPGEVYLIETKSNRLFKRLYWNKDKSAYVCYSDNHMKHEHGPKTGEYFYEAFEVSKDDVIRIFDITGMIKRLRNSGIMSRA